MFEVYDRVTQQVVATVKTKEAARRSVDRRDNAYGCYRYSWRYADKVQGPALLGGN